MAASINGELAAAAANRMKENSATKAAKTRRGIKSEMA
jgi:hypothetical protein